MQADIRGQVIQSAATVYHSFFVPALFAEWPSRLCKLANTRPGQKVLDVACGTGVLASHLATLLGNTGHVTGVDINPGMLAVAQQQYSNIDWQQAPAEQLPFDDARFDAVLSQFGLMFFSHRIQAIREMLRVVTADGVVVIAVWDSLSKNPGYDLVCTLLQELFGEQVANEIRAPYGLGKRDKLTLLFNSAGVNQIEISTRTGQARFESIDSWMYTDIKGWTLADKLDDRQFAQLKEYAHERLKQFTDRSGVVRFPTSAHIIKVTK